MLNSLAAGVIGQLVVQSAFRFKSQAVDMSVVLGKALLAIAAVGVLSMSLCLAALRGRTRRG
jgi:hypothetical protein